MSDLDTLKTLLFGAEKEVLDSIQQRVQTPEARAADIAAVLPDAIRLRHREDDELVDSLRDPVGRCVRESIRESPQEFADALYPVMGPAIRKSIAHALKAFAEQINRTLEHSLTVKGLKWRMQAARAGVPFASYVIQQSLLYRVEQAYLISRENGLLISHVHHDASRIKDSDAVSAMFTAIQDFVKESFSPDRTGRLETADMGDFTLWAVHGPHALLVCVIRGVPPRGLRTDLSRILERLHFRFGDALRDYSGDTTTVAGIEEELEPSLLFEASRPRDAEKKKPPWPLIIIAVLVLAAVAYGAWIAWQETQRQSRLEAAIESTPGVFVAEVETRDGFYLLHGLADPLAPGLDDIARRAGLDAGQLQGRLQPYRSLNESIVLQRARLQLQPEDGTRIQLVDGALLVSGTATSAWITRAQQQAAFLDLGLPLRFGDLLASDQHLADWERLVERAAELDGAIFYFARSSELSAESRDRLAVYAVEVDKLASDAVAINAAIDIRITGHTDSSGSAALNARLAKDRANVVSAALLDAGVGAQQLTVLQQMAEESGSAADPAMRSTSVSVDLVAPAE